jgi:hypothetical protein
MTDRERILALAVLVIVGLLGAKWGYGKYSRSMEVHAGELRTATEQLSNEKVKVQRGLRAMKKLDTWQQRSLPANREKALSLYKAWLLEKAKEAGLTVDDIKPSARTTPSATFAAIGYQIEANGSLAALTKLLYEFYSSPHLQQITRLRLNHPPGATQLGISLEVEALCLPGALATDAMPEGKASRLKLASLEKYQKSLGDRDLVSVYAPPRPPREKSEVASNAPPPPPKFDDASHAFFSATVGNGKGLQAWINVRPTGEMLRVNVGDPVKVGTFEGEVVSIEPRTIVFKMGDDKQVRVKLGETLRKDEADKPASES